MLDLCLPLAALLPHSIGPYIAVMLSGFAIGALGYGSSSRWLVAAGVILVFLGAFLFPLALTVSTETPPRGRERPLALIVRTIGRPSPDSRRSSALSRVRIFLVFAALAGLATVFAACGSSGGGSDETPQDVLKDATFEGIESANLDASIGVDVSGDEGGNVDVEVSGPFQKQGGGQYPELDLTAKVSGSVNGNDLDKEAGLVLVPNKAFVSYEGESYEVDPTTFSFIESAINQAGKNGETPTEASSALPGSGGRTQRRRLRRKLQQRRRGRRRRDRNDQDQRRPQRPRRVRPDPQARRRPGLQLLAGKRRAAAACAARPNPSRKSKRPSREPTWRSTSAKTRSSAGSSPNSRSSPKAAPKKGRNQHRHRLRRSQRRTGNHDPLGRQAPQRAVPEAGRQPDRTARRHAGRARASTSKACWGRGRPAAAGMRAGAIEECASQATSAADCRNALK